MSAENFETGDVPPPAKHPARGVYWLPNVFTTGTLFGGFYAIVAAINGDFSRAGIAIFVAMLFDGLDGRVALLIGAILVVSGPTWSCRCCPSCARRARCGRCWPGRACSWTRWARC
jgi:hypothetical protein